jgi:7-carboxy-7-deazaguanine synthase
MPPPPTLRIAEVFASIQGEGLRQGEPTIFVRMAGCNLRCAFCDTKRAWTGGRILAVDKVLENIRAASLSFPAQWVCLTGGEPLLQDLNMLVRELKKMGFRIQAETNGTIYRRFPIDWYTVSPKPPNFLCRDEYKKKAREVKLIVTRDLGLGRIKRIREEFSPAIPLLLQPQSDRKWSVERAFALLLKSLQAGLGNIRLSAQWHKILRLR